MELQPSNKNEVITVSDVRKRFRTFKRGAGLRESFLSVFKRHHVMKDALAGVSLSVREGEIVGLLGPNGAGKSTLIKVLCGILHPDSGSVSVLGFQPWSQRVRYVQHIGAVFGQRPQLLWELPAVDSYDLFKHLYRIPDAEFKRRLGRMVSLLDVGHVINTPVRDLSLGERMRCEVIGALLHKPRLVFLDEPTIGLDIVAKDILRDFILEMNKKERTTFIVTTHDMQDVERLCERIVVVNHGRKVFDGPLAKLREHARDKHVTISFETVPGAFSFPGARIISQQRYQWELELDTRKSSVAKLVAHLLEKYVVADIGIEDPPVEEVIKRIYGE